MADARTREHERAAATGDVVAAARVIVARVRAGTLTAKGVELAAFLGHSTARVAMPSARAEVCSSLQCGRPIHEHPIPRRLTAGPGRERVLTCPGAPTLGLMMHGIATFGHEACVRTALAWSHLVLMPWAEFMASTDTVPTVPDPAAQAAIAHQQVLRRARAPHGAIRAVAAWLANPTHGHLCDVLAAHNQLGWSGTPPRWATALTHITMYPDEMSAERLVAGVQNAAACFTAARLTSGAAPPSTSVRAAVCKALLAWVGMA